MFSPYQALLSSAVDVMLLMSVDSRKKFSVFFFLGETTNQFEFRRLSIIRFTAFLLLNAERYVKLLVVLSFFSFHCGVS